MRWNITTREAKLARLKDWHPFFCLLPRKVGKECVWLETVERKGRFVHIDDDVYPYKIYSYWDWCFRLPLQKY